MAHASHHHLLSITTLANAAVTTTDPCDTAHPQKPILDIAVKEASAASHNTTQQRQFVNALFHNEHTYGAINLFSTTDSSFLFSIGNRLVAPSEQR